MRIGDLLLVLLLASGLSFGAFAQVAQVSKGQPQSVIDRLRQHGIAVDEQSLLLALSNSDPQIRSLAATQLGAQRTNNALSGLKDALNTESDGSVKSDIAASVARLGDTTGIASLRATCDERNIDADVRLRAARHLQDLGDDYCYGMVERITEVASDPDIRVKGIYMLTSELNYRKHDQGRVMILLAKSLEDSAINVRLTASDRLSHLGGSTAEALLKRAISGEVDPSVRSSMEEDLRKLRKQETFKNDGQK